MRIPRLFTAVLFLFLFSLPATAQDQAKTAEIVRELTQKAQNIQSYTVDVHMQTMAMGENIATNGTMAFKEPGLMRMTTTTEMMGGMQQDIYKSGDVIWTYMPLMRMATKVDLSKIKETMPGQEGMDEGNLSEMLENIPEDALTFLEKRKADDKDVYAFRMSADKLKQDMTSPQKTFPIIPQKVEFLVYADNGLPYKVQTYGKNDELIMEQTYSNYQLNVDIPDSQFEFTPPEGVQVMDMTEATINMMKQMRKGGEAQPAE
jgi:outer membrane lipoprotein-sorting protein